jgi:hypothetical protein
MAQKIRAVPAGSSPIALRAVPGRGRAICALGRRELSVVRVRHGATAGLPNWEPFRLSLREMERNGDLGLC